MGRVVLVSISYSWLSLVLASQLCIACKEEREVCLHVYSCDLTCQCGAVCLFCVTQLIDCTRMKAWSVNGQVSCSRKRHSRN